MISALPSAIMTMKRKQECPLPFPGKKPRQTISALMCAGVLRGGFLHTTSERGEGYIAYKLPKEKMGLKTMWPIACGMLHNSTLKRFLQFGIAIKRGGATASLDVENETAIQGALSRLIKNKTVLIIAHRMRTVAGADQVWCCRVASWPSRAARQSCTPGRDCTPTWWICSRQARTGRSENEGGFYLGKSLAFS